jgi:hypothetical protein
MKTGTSCCFVFAGKSVPGFGFFLFILEFVWLLNLDGFQILILNLTESLDTSSLKNGVF